MNHLFTLTYNKTKYIIDIERENDLFLESSFRIWYIERNFLWLEMFSEIDYGIYRPFCFRFEHFY